MVELVLKVYVRALAVLLHGDYLLVPGLFMIRLMVLRLQKLIQIRLSHVSNDPNWAQILQREVVALHGFNFLSHDMRRWMLVQRKAVFEADVSLIQLSLLDLLFVPWRLLELLFEVLDLQMQAVDVKLHLVIIVILGDVLRVQLWILVFGSLEEVRGAVRQVCWLNVEESVLEQGLAVCVAAGADGRLKVHLLLGDFRLELTSVYRVLVSAEESMIALI